MQPAPRGTGWSPALQRRRQPSYSEAHPTPPEAPLIWNSQSCHPAPSTLGLTCFHPSHRHSGLQKGPPRKVEVRDSLLGMSSPFTLHSAEIYSLSSWVAPEPETTECKWITATGWSQSWPVAWGHEEGEERSWPELTPHHETWHYHRDVVMWSRLRYSENTDEWNLFWRLSKEGCMLIPFLPPANKYCGVNVFCLQVGLKVNVMCQCATARCSALLQIAPDCLSAGYWELGVPGHCTCITTLGHGASHGPVGGETIQWRFSAKSLFFKYWLRTPLSLA